MNQTWLNFRDCSPHARLCQLTFVLAAILKQSTSHMWRMSQGGWSWCLTWLCFTVWSTRYIHPSLHEFCLSSLPFSAPLLWYLLCAHLSQKWISWAPLWFWYCWWGFGLRSMCYDLSATPPKQRRLLWWLRITSMPSTLMATSMPWTGSRTSKSILR